MVQIWFKYIFVDKMFKYNILKDEWKEINTRCEQFCTFQKLIKSSIKHIYRALHSITIYNNDVSNGILDIDNRVNN